MSLTVTFAGTARIDEPESAQAYSDVLSQVASGGQSLIVRRGGIDLAAVISVEHFELLQDALAFQEAEIMAKRVDWPKYAKSNRPAQEWFEGDEPKPF